MKKIILFILLFISILSYSQARLGYSYQEIKKEYSKEQAEFNYVSSGPCFMVFYDKVDVFYYFNTNFICVQTSIVTENLIIRNKIIKTYDQNYKRLTKSTWEVFDNGNIYIITYRFEKGIGYIFSWN